MNDFLMVSCGIMIIIFIIGQAYETSQLQTINGITYTGIGMNGTTQYLNGTQTTYTFGDQSLFLGISVTEGVMMGLTILGILGLVIASGINIATWSLSDMAQRAILNFGLYGAIWSIFSITTFTFLVSNEFSYGLGWLIFFFISFIHLIGIIKIINKGA